MEEDAASGESGRHGRSGVVRVLCAVLLTVGLAAACGGESSASDTPGAATVTRVVDGDTVRVDLDGARETVRLVGINTPETVAPDRPVECYGPEASAHLKELLPDGTEVRLERDVEARDRYGRLLAYVYRTDDDLFVNVDLVAGGYAQARSYPPNTTLESELQAAQQQARSTGAGQWGACSPAQQPQ